MPLQAAEPLQTAEKDKTSASKHRLFGRNFEQATGKRRQFAASRHRTGENTVVIVD